MYLAQLKNIPIGLIVEVIIGCLIINIAYTCIYYYMYKKNYIHFTHFFTLDKNHKISFGDFFYFSHNLY